MAQTHTTLARFVNMYNLWHNKTVEMNCWNVRSGSKQWKKVPFHNGRKKTSETNNSNHWHWNLSRSNINESGNWHEMNEYPSYIHSLSSFIDRGAFSCATKLREKVKKIELNNFSGQKIALQINSKIKIHVLCTLILVSIQTQLINWFAKKKHTQRMQLTRIPHNFISFFIQLRNLRIVFVYTMDIPHILIRWQYSLLRLVIIHAACVLCLFVFGFSVSIQSCQFSALLKWVSSFICNYQLINSRCVRVYTSVQIWSQSQWCQQFI